MRTIWNGSISFGLVNIPVGLALATTPKAKQSDVSFRTLHRECKTPIRQKRWCPTHEREVGPDEIVKGWEVAKGEFVIVEDGLGQTRNVGRRTGRGWRDPLAVLVGEPTEQQVIRGRLAPRLVQLPHRLVHPVRGDGAV